jgi:hypothetical protein
VAQRQIKMPVKDKRVPGKESSEEAPSQRKQTEAGRYLLQVDRQTVLTTRQRRQRQLLPSACHGTSATIRSTSSPLVRPGCREAINGLTACS